MNLADRLATMFPDDPMLPAMADACERDDLAFAVYLRCEWLRAMWTHPRGETKHLRAFLRNPAWPARALEACHRYAVPAPAWVTAWTMDLSTRRVDPPRPADHQRASRLDAALAVMAAPSRGLPAADQVAEGIALNAEDANRMRHALELFLDSLGMPRAGK